LPDEVREFFREDDPGAAPVVEAEIEAWAARVVSRRRKPKEASRPKVMSRIDQPGMEG
jgi:hypothetical protein